MLNYFWSPKATRDGITLEIMPNKITSYIRESKDELKKVVWPSRKETTKLTLLVIGISLFVAIFLGAVDFLLTIGLDKIFTK